MTEIARTRTMDGSGSLGTWLALRVDDMQAGLSGREPLNGAAEP
jgi:hypothetical protein